MLLNICTFKIKSNLKTLLILQSDTKTRATANLYSSKYFCEKKLKACQEWPHLVSGPFMKVFYKTNTCPRLPLLNGPNSGHLIYRFHYTASLKARTHLLKGDWGQSNNVCLKWFFLIKQNDMNQTWPKYRCHNHQILKSHK